MSLKLVRLLSIVTSLFSTCCCYMYSLYFVLQCTCSLSSGMPSIKRCSIKYFLGIKWKFRTKITVSNHPTYPHLLHACLLLGTPSRLFSFCPLYRIYSDIVNTDANIQDGVLDLSNKHLTNVCPNFKVQYNDVVVLNLSQNSLHSLKSELFPNCVKVSHIGCHYLSF